MQSKPTSVKSFSHTPAGQYFLHYTKKFKNSFHVNILIIILCKITIQNINKILYICIHHHHNTSLRIRQNYTTPPCQCQLIRATLYNII